MSVRGVEALYTEEGPKSLAEQKLKFTLTLEVISPKLGSNPTANPTSPSTPHYTSSPKKLPTTPQASRILLSEAPQEGY